MAELGIISATDIASVAKLISVLRDAHDTHLLGAVCSALFEMSAQIEKLTAPHDRR